MSDVVTGALRPIASPADLRAVMQEDYEVSPQQWQAISAPLAPAVVIAGAGSGKTTLMAARVVYLVVTGQVRPDEVLGLTFTTKAASELRSRIRAALVTAGVLDDTARTTPAGEDPEDTLEPTVVTYNAYAAQLLDQHGLRIGHEPDTRVITDASRYQLGARAVERYRGDVHELSDHPPTVIQNLLALDSAMTEHLVSPEQVLEHDAAERVRFEAALEAEVAGKNRSTYREAPAKAISAIDRRRDLMGLVRAYRRLKADLGLMDFADQIALGARLAAEQPEVGELERATHRVVLLDEYQDTSVAQALMLARLYSGPAPGSGLGHPVTAVGDPNQAIYGWRGASVSNILTFGETFPAVTGEVPVLPLTVNRRSDRRILEVANHLAEPLYAATPSVAPLDAARDVDGTVTTRVFETLDEELAWLAEAVQQAHAESDGPATWSDIGVLTRDNATAEAVFDSLTAAGVPVEIVGLSGLLRLPEVAEVAATLTLLHDVTASSALVTLLTGPRWAIGPRDLRLLAERAEEIAGRRGRRGEVAGVTEELSAIADGVDPAETAALTDALADPGEAAYSPQARQRFGLLAAELRSLRTSVGEPLLDVVRRIVDVTGVDVELASAVSDAAVARRDNLDLFLKAVGDFQSLDGDVTLAALLAYLTAEDDAGNGLDLATPTQADSVKLLTVHRSKGLEWHSVFLVGVCETRFPSNRSRSLWISSPAVLPAPLRGDARDQPQLRGHDKQAVDAYRAATRSHGAEEELRLGYVALTRAAHRLSVTSHLWATRATPYGPSDYQRSLRERLEGWGEQVDWLDKPERGAAANPYDQVDRTSPWPAPGLGREAELRRLAAAVVQAAAPVSPETDERLDVVQAATVAQWDAEIDRLLAEARAERAHEVRVALPPSLSATAIARLRDDPAGFARELARPMPRPPAPAARFGTRFHAWVEARFGQQSLLDADELAGRADAGIDDDADLALLAARFEAGDFGDRAPHATEAPFSLVLAGQVVRGRIDAVYREPDGSWLVVDWKTQRQETADPVQLATYRLAWAELEGVPLAQVRAAFHYVRSGRTVEPGDLLGREELETLLAPG
ncbi:ATP-dependent DNA helicase [Nocardioides aequoreus]|uniref:ATP-dependent DNA helicase n=1 Tax=Nocardioides aequoreus TaxID=397278 RepID=UPI000B009F94|nr:ATP-dependent DNA helicase [Nocardioides aequoreus]